MFDRYTERARRVVFFARHEVSQTGSDSISTEHLLLGLMRENRYLLPEFPPEKDLASLKADFFGPGPFKTFSTSVDIPLDAAAERALKQAVEECVSDYVKVTSGHLLLGILGQGDTQAASILKRHGMGREQILARMPKSKDEEGPPDPNSGIDFGDLLG